VSRASWIQSAQDALGSRFTDLHRVGGGDFAESYSTTTADGRALFIKTHSDPPAHFFSTEAQGLRWLAKALGNEQCGARVATVLASSDDPPYLVLEWIDIGWHKADTEAAFGRALAKIHQAEQSVFGRTDERTTGSLGVPNAPCSDWVTFFAENRLIPLAKKAHELGVFPAATAAAIEQLSQRLDQLEVPVEPPALLHGDLWAGNRVVDTHGVSWLIDPAAHGGHREFDLAMMRLFSGFGDAVFAAYEEVHPLAKGWQERIALHQLAPLTVHAIKFGGHYFDAVHRALAAYQ